MMELKRYGRTKGAVCDRFRERRYGLE